MSNVANYFNQPQGNTDDNVLYIGGTLEVGPTGSIKIRGAEALLNTQSWTPSFFTPLNSGVAVIPGIPDAGANIFVLDFMIFVRATFTSATTPALQIGDTSSSANVASIAFSALTAGACIRPETSGVTLGLAFQSGLLENSAVIAKVASGSYTAGTANFLMTYRVA